MAMLALPEWSSLGMFVAAALLLLLTPGPAVLYIVARSMDQGRRAGLVSMLGVHAGTLAHIGAAAAGLSAVLMASATAFAASAIGPWPPRRGRPPCRSAARSPMASSSTS